MTIGLCSHVSSTLLAWGFWRVLLDEAQLVAHTSSVAAQKASSLWRRHAWTVTGTPLSNRLSEIKVTHPHQCAAVPSMPSGTIGSCEHTGVVTTSLPHRGAGASPALFYVTHALFQVAVQGGLLQELHCWPHFRLGPAVILPSPFAQIEPPDRGSCAADGLVWPDIRMLVLSNLCATDFLNPAAVRKSCYNHTCKMHQEKSTSMCRFTAVNN